MNNPYVPIPVKLKAVRNENEVGDLKTFELVFVNTEDAGHFKFASGQFAMLSINGVGEAPFGIASSPMVKEMIRFTVKKYPKGILTTALHNLNVGDILGMRGPLGNSYPLKEMESKNILLVGGGFALTTLRSLAKYLLHEKNRPRYGAITLFVAARDPGEILYKDDLAEWEKRDDIEVIQTIDRAVEGWPHKVGYAAPVLRDLAPNPENTAALVCGPPIMIDTCMEVLSGLGFSDEAIVTSLEMKMKCGIGKCGRCNIGSKYICKDGPVFTSKQLKELTVHAG